MANAQVNVVMCDLCESTKSVSWKCINCEEFLREGCRNIHLKGRATRDHEVVQRGSQRSAVFDAYLLSSFSVDIKSYNGVVVSVTPVTKQSAWIGMERGASLNLRDSEGKTLGDNPPKFSDWISSLAVSDDGFLFVTIPLKGQVLKISPTFDVTNIFAYFEHLQPRGICITKAGQIIVSVVDDYSVTTNKDSVRLLYKLNKNGIIVETFGHISPDKNMFTIPRRLKENINGDIIVIDKTGLLYADIVCLDQTGALRFRYKGHQMEDQETNFNASDMAIDKTEGKIIVTEQSQKQIHVIDKDGNFVQYLRTNASIDEIPRSVALAPDGLLWIGYTERKVATFEYLL